MSILGIGGSIRAIEAATEILLDLDAVKDVIAILDDSIAEIEAKPVEPIPANAFGSSDTALELGHHTVLARETVVEALQDVMAGLRVYADNIVAYQKDTFGTDETVSTTVAPLQAGIDCMDGAFRAQNQAPTRCVAPSGSEAG